MEAGEIMDFVREQFSTVNREFCEVNKKLDKLTELTEQTHLQEYRLNQMEEQIKQMQKSRSDTLSKILTPVISSVISAVISFIIAGGLVK